jgi:hypothetical protein
MSGFSAEWLALREPADAAARSTTVEQFVSRALSSCGPLRIVDLGSGTGSNVRYLSARLPGPRQWRLVDNDAALLTRARELLPIPVEARISDLGNLESDVFSGCHLVTASALLDLVSESWLTDLVARCRRAGSAVLVALNYDGRVECTPAHNDDELVREMVNRHQRTDKGFGPALGPSAGTRAEAALREAGYDVIRDKSDWNLGPADTELQRQLIRGWASAATELSPSDAPRIHRWECRRMDSVAAGVSSLVVGHDDVGAVLVHAPVVR